MKREQTNAIIYKLHKYSEQSAIAFGFSEHFGRLKLFIPKAYTKKGGVMRFIPGNLDFLHKDSSDLSKMYDFRQDSTFYHYIDNKEILFRLHMVFEVLDAVYEPEHPDPILWKLLGKYTAENAIKLTLYILYAMLRQTGYLFDPRICGSCGREIQEGRLYEGVLTCEHCLDAYSGIPVDARSLFLLRTFDSKELFQRTEMNRADEAALLKVLFAHVEAITEKKLKTLKFFLEMS